MKDLVKKAVCSLEANLTPSVVMYLNGGHWLVTDELPVELEALLALLGAVLVEEKVGEVQGELAALEGLAPVLHVLVFLHVPLQLRPPKRRG